MDDSRLDRLYLEMAASAPPDLEARLMALTRRPRFVLRAVPWDVLLLSLALLPLIPYALRLLGALLERIAVLLS